MTESDDGVRRKYEALTNCLSCKVDERDYEHLQPQLASLQELAGVENRSISLYDINRASFLLKTDKHLELLGYEPQDISIGNYHAMIHPQDVVFLYDAELKMYDFLAKRDKDKKDYKLVYDYRVRAKDGRYIRFLHQMAIFACDRENRAWIMLIVSDILSQFPENEEPRRFLINTKNQKVCLFNEENQIADHLVTAREKEILSLIAGGLDSQSIADRLCLSLHTVNNHRQNILRKTRTKSIAQAAYYLRCIGLC
ncbi:helix-turn-helix transcriptional regulator [Sphaerochaeta sp.]|uniref:helix-turn-helix transcriptional regulator n=1 Tax=Sphaerochaeta sp. TaxID=1972642 RepID=UPI002FC862DF